MKIFVSGNNMHAHYPQQSFSFPLANCTATGALPIRFFLIVFVFFIPFGQNDPKLQNRRSSATYFRTKTDSNLNPISIFFSRAPTLPIYYLGRSLALAFVSASRLTPVERFVNEKYANASETNVSCIFF